MAEYRQMSSEYSEFRGLSVAEAADRLARFGANDLPQASRRSVLAVLLGVLREPMLALLLAAGGVYLILGDRLEAAALLVFASLSVVITVVQAQRSERVLEALRDISSPRARVVRDGKAQRIAGREVVCGDLLLLTEGDRVPADAVLLTGDEVVADESLLTGESVPVAKRPHRIASTTLTGGCIDVGGARPPGAPERGPMPQTGASPVNRILGGTLLVRGEGLARVVATGDRSAIGRIGRSLGDIEAVAPRLQAQTTRLARLLGSVGIGISLLAFVLQGLARDDWLRALLAAIALGMSMLPEELPVVLTVFTAMGAWRISRVGVLTRRAAAIETLGAATVLCVDKTGTLTENRMRIVATWTPVGGDDAPLLEAGRLASADHPVDPMERAFAERVPALPRGLWTLGSARPRASRPLMLRVWTLADIRRIVCKGAPEAVLALCDADAAARGDALGVAAEMAARGLRVLAVADAATGSAQAAASDAAALLDSPPPLRLLGLVALADPLRADVPRAIAECRSAGLRVLMITGDHPGTALAIAREAGLSGDGGLGIESPANATLPLTGEDIDHLDDAALTAQLTTATVCARTRPEQKLRIVRGLQAQGHVVAMTGDGVNDAPALKAADIGIAMGGRGSDVAREAASLVLLGDDFAAMVAAIRLGRRIGDNLRKAVRFIFAVHVPVAGLALLPLVLDLPVLLGPLHIALLEMAIDPLCALAFEAEPGEPDIMARPPRAPDDPLLPRAALITALLQGLSALAACCAMLALAAQRNLPPDETRSLVFVTLVAAIFVLVTANRRLGAGLASFAPTGNLTLFVIALIVTTVLAVALLWPAAARPLGLGPLHGHDVALVFVVNAGLLALLQALKRLRG